MIRRSNNKTILQSRRDWSRIKNSQGVDIFERCSANKMRRAEHDALSLIYIYIKK